MRNVAKYVALAVVTLMFTACASTNTNTPSPAVYDADGDGFEHRGAGIPEIDYNLKVPNDQPTWRAKMRRYNEGLKTAFNRWGNDLDYKVKDTPLSKAESNCFKAQLALAMERAILLGASLSSDPAVFANAEANVNFFSEQVRAWCNGGGPNGSTNRGLLVFNEARDAFGENPNDALSKSGIAAQVALWKDVLSESAKYSLAILSTQYYYLTPKSGPTVSSSEAREKIEDDKSATTAAYAGAAFIIFITSGGFVLP